ncbi:hydroxyacylglutathione hydrolase [Paludibacterium sp. B53371]|uniref:hydroxyacylglutathione hydrolase n=1 Tax=Paludibacterium sp. B53371 TaxID=2806263 RepID=UPI001C050BFF|nr:hydroxyacylglutathione hydrolase [Paludibacterium sp. B53371]
MLVLSPVSAFSDNYIWVLHNGSDALAVDPGDARPLLAFLQQQQLQLQTVLITHRHDDHVGGLPMLRNHFPAMQLIGPATLPGVDLAVDHGRQIRALGLDIAVMAVPGHTLDHLAYYAAPWLFCGDTLFGAGCGRLFEGSPAQMAASLSQLAGLPPETLVCPAHEYTLSNLQFAKHIEPFNQDINQRLANDQARRNQAQPTLPSRLSLELATNPFLRCHTPSIREQIERRENRKMDSEVEIFAALRRWKDGFKSQDV